MKKKIAILIITAVLLISFAACSADTADYYTDDNGVQYMVNRDSDGDIQINENGKLLVYTLNENGKRIKSDTGEYITEYVDFNGQVVSGNNVEISEMRFVLPSGFSEDRNNPGYFCSKSYDGEIFVNYYTDDIDLCVESIEYSCQGLLESFGSEVYSYKQYTVKVDGVECIAFEQLCTSSEYYRNAFVYLVPYDSGYYYFDCSVSTDNKNKVDFDKFIESIEFKDV